MTTQQMQHFLTFHFHRSTNGPTGVERFWKRVDKKSDDECWLWTGPVNKSGGYGVIAVAGFVTTAHRVSYELVHGPVGNTYDVCILHTCDNPPCCNPNHLFKGTRKDNVADMVQKGRMAGARGTRNCKVVLSEAQVLEIFNSDASNVDLGIIYSIAPTTVSAIRRQENWKFLTGAEAPKSRKGKNHRIYSVREDTSWPHSQLPLKLK
jgi:hypothetical protein